MILYCKVYQFTDSGKPIDKSPCLIRFKKITGDSETFYLPDKIIKENFASMNGFIEILNDSSGSVICNDIYINFKITDLNNLPVTDTYGKKIEREFFFAADDASAILLCEI